MIQQRIHAAGAAEISPQIRDALEDASPAIARYQEVTQRLGRGKPGTLPYQQDEAYARSLLDQIDSRARRVELDDGETMTGDGLVAYALAAGRARSRLPAQPGRATERLLHERLQQAMAKATVARRVLNEAQAAFADAAREERAATEAYRAHGGAVVLR